MKRKLAARMALKHAFWLVYPSLSLDERYSFNQVFPGLPRRVYEDVFWEMVEAGELPLLEDQIVVNDWDSYVVLDHSN